MTFSNNQRVVVLAENPAGNPRTPPYLRGKAGTIMKSHGVVVNPLDHREPYPPLYTVLFELESGDEVSADIHEDWLKAAT